MRNIKFRAWNGEKMTTSFEITSQGVVASHFGKKEYHPDYLLMQYTGLKDKNGKEIYEGDIVKLTAIGGYLQDGSFEVENIISFHENFSHDDRYYQMDKEKIEIIGNIYENPELLK